MAVELSSCIPTQLVGSSPLVLSLPFTPTATPLLAASANRTATASLVADTCSRAIAGSRVCPTTVRMMTDPRTTAHGVQRVAIVFTPPQHSSHLPSSASLTAASASPPNTFSSLSSPTLSATALSPHRPSHHRRRSSVQRSPRLSRRSSQLHLSANSLRPPLDEHKESDSGDDTSAVGEDPFASYLTHHSPAGAGHVSKATMSGLGFTASLAMRRVAMIAKILSSLKRCPLVNPTHITPRSRPATVMQSSHHSKSLTASGYPSTFLPHLQLLAHHPSLTVLPYPASSILTHQSSSPSLIHLLVSGTVRVVCDGVELAHIGRGAVIGAEVCVFSTEGYRRWRRTLWKRRQRQKRQDEADGVDKRQPHTREEIREAERDRELNEDEKELAFADELRRGKKRRKMKSSQFCTVQCLTPCECVVFPASVLRDYLESDNGLRRNSYRWLMEAQWVRRRQWRDGDKRLHRVWGPGGLHVDAEDRTIDNARDTADLAALTGNDDIEVEAGALDRAVLGSSGFLYHNVVQPADNDDEQRKSHATHAQNANLHHPLYTRNEDGTHDKRVRLRVRDDMGGEKQQKAEMRKVKEKEDKAKKVRKIIGAMERKRRDAKQQHSAAKQGSGEEEEEEEEEEDEDEDEYEEEEEDEETNDVDPALLDIRYAAAIAASIAQNGRGTSRDRRGSKLSTPKFKLSRRLKDDEVRAVDDRLLGRAAVKAIINASHRRDPTRVDVSLLNFTPHTAARRMVAREEAESDEEWERRVNAEATDMRAQWKRVDEQKVQQRLKSPYVDINFLRPATAPAARQLGGEQTVIGGPLRSLASGVYNKRKGVISEGAARTREREAEETAHRAIGQLRADKPHVSSKPAVAAAAVAAHTLSSATTLGLITRMLAEAEQRWAKPDRQLRQMVEWDISAHIVEPEEEEQKVQEVMQRVREVSHDDWLSDEEEDSADRLGPLHSSAAAPAELVIDAECEMTEGAERPILLSPQSTVTTPFAALPPKPLFFPLPPPSVREPSAAQPSQSARPATAPSKLATQPQFTFSPQLPDRCLTSRPAFGPAAQTASPRVRQVVTARERRAAAAVGASISSVMRYADNKALPWETRLALLTEASGMQAAEAERRREARDLKSDRDKIAAAMKATVSTSRVAVPFAAGGGVRVMECSGERPPSRGAVARGAMRRYATRLSHALSDMA